MSKPWSSAPWPGTRPTVLQNRSASKAALGISQGAAICWKRASRILWYQTVNLDLTNAWPCDKMEIESCVESGALLPRHLPESPRDLLAFLLERSLL